MPKEAKMRYSAVPVKGDLTKWTFWAGKRFKFTMEEYANSDGLIYLTADLLTPPYGHDQAKTLGGCVRFIIENLLADESAGSEQNNTAVENLYRVSKKLYDLDPMLYMSDRDSIKPGERVTIKRFKG